MMGREGGWKERGGGVGDKVGKSDLKMKRKEFSGKVGIQGKGAMGQKSKGMEVGKLL
jgi:hypothetical protein